MRAVLLFASGDAITFRPVLDDSGDRPICILAELDNVPFHAEAGFATSRSVNFSHAARIDHQMIPFQSDDDACG